MCLPENLYSGETLIRDKLRSLTGLKWERTPGSGALGAQHNLKGDLYVVNADNKYCIEVKSYADDHLTSKYLTGKTPQISEWWTQAKSQAAKVDKIPLLIFKFDRSKIFVAWGDDPTVYKPESSVYMYLGRDKIFVALLEDWINFYKPTFVN